MGGGEVFDEFKPVSPRQSEVGDDEIRLGGFDEVQRIPNGGGGAANSQSSLRIDQVAEAFA